MFPIFPHALYMCLGLLLHPDCERYIQYKTFREIPAPGKPKLAVLVTDPIVDKHLHLVLTRNISKTLWSLLNLSGPSRNFLF